MERNSGFGQIMEEGDNPGFFKILRREDLSSEIMVTLLIFSYLEFLRMIPHDFIRSVSQSSSSFKMDLKVPWGNSWPVKISKNPSFHYMEDRGWNQFVSDNALGENEYLTFTHEGNMYFSVSIYEPDGTEMLRPRKSVTIASSSGLNKTEQRKGLYKDVKEEEIVSSSESSYHGLKSRLKQKRGSNLGKKKAEETVKSKKKKKKVDTACNDFEAGTSSLVPEFNITIKKSHLLFLAIPKWFVDKHMPKETKMFKIHSKGMDSGEVLYLVTDVQTRFSAGWSRLAKGLGLEVGDVCKFKLIKPTEMLLEFSRDDEEEYDDDDDDDEEEEYDDDI
ncbi:unnamed protein product [Thlaspi arvense]|uniref:TF-B3 domain-containing protein n=1 Tax=Thlaspi arvense TaxID=13288 RepID=A0AAU9SWS3_THLAR|nr:unnamed protein product [Thlaspi arvense]